ncbi:MAG: LemA family protein [Candidatus Omnitrophica bacterium]|nr:LemA family protein [Candidatus Omnitrophota bacterium]
MGLLIVIALIFAVFFAGIVIYNQLVKYSFLVKEAWAGIDVQLKRRHDLIPSLVESAKGYAKYEQGVFEKVTSLRAEIVNAKNNKQASGLENDLSRAIKSIFLVAENYPNLKASQNFIDLQKNISLVEDNIQMARRYYNGTVRDYNVAIQSFPGVVIANLFRFSPIDFFEIEYSTERNSPDVEFGSKQ